jgi:hypothetical protein
MPRQGLKPTPEIPIVGSPPVTDDHELFGALALPGRGVGFSNGRLHEIGDELVQRADGHQARITVLDRVDAPLAEELAHLARADANCVRGIVRP